MDFEMSYIFETQQIHSILHFLIFASRIYNIKLHFSG